MGLPPSSEAYPTELLTPDTWDDGAGPEELFTELGFVRDRKIAKWRWVMRTEV